MGEKFISGAAVPPKHPKLSLQSLILKGYAFGIAFLKPFFRGVRGGEDLDVLGVANLFAAVDVDKDGYGTTLYALAFLLVACHLGSARRLLNEKRPQLTQVRGGAVIPMRQSGKLNWRQHQHA